MMDAESQRTSRRFRNAADPLIFALAALGVDGKPDVYPARAREVVGMSANDSAPPRNKKCRRKGKPKNRRGIKRKATQ